MQTTKINLDMGTKKWASQMENFQSCSPHMPWEQGKQLAIASVEIGQHKGLQAFSESQMQRLLNDNLHNLQFQELNKLEWDVWGARKLSQNS